MLVKYTSNRDKRHISRTTQESRYNRSLNWEDIIRGQRMAGDQGSGVYSDMLSEEPYLGDK